MTLTALLIGNESLTAECGNLWLERGHTLAGVVTREPKIAAWAAGKGLSIVPPGQAVAVDWVLSVANLSLVPAAVLQAARRGGGLVHDGPLPG